MSSRRLSPRLIIAIVLLVFFGVSLLIRIALPFDQVFDDPWIKETSVDGYYYMRLVDNMVHNFPHYTGFDPFHIFPGGQEIEHLGLFYQLLAGFIWLIGLGHPSQHLVDVIGALFSPFLAALTLIPVYFIGKALFNRWVGVIAAALMAVLPGEYLGRSILGFADTPVIETFFTAAAMAFFVMAVKTAAQRQLNVSHFLKLDRGVFLRPLIYTLLAGVFLGIYMATWNGALLFVFIIALYLVVQFIIDHLRGTSDGRRTEYLGIVGFLFFLVAAVIFLPGSPEVYMSAAAVIAILIPAAMAAVSRFMAGRGLRPAYYPLAVLGLAAAAVLIFWGVSPRILGLMFSTFGIFAPVGATATTTMEMQPFLSPSGSFSTGVAWGNFTTSFFLVPDWPIPGFAFISLVILIVLYFKRRSQDKVLPLLFIWTVIILILTLVQRRFAYYLVVNMALLSAWLSWEVVWLFSLRKLVEKPEKLPEDSKLKKHRRRQTGPGTAGYRVITGLVAAVVFAVVFIPNIVKANDVASEPAFLPSDAWQESLTWMKDNTPEPLGDPEAYYGLYNRSFVYPASAYGVTSWWDYGYWITRIAHRIPSANPSQEAEPIEKISALFLSENASLAESILRELQTSYIIGDYTVATSKFWAIATWAGEPPEKYMPTFYVQRDNEIVPVSLYAPEYFRTFYVRLFNFDGKAVTKYKAIVLTYSERAGSKGSYRLVTAYKEFNDYQAALAYVAQNGPENLAIVSNNPFVSPIPLEPVPDFSLVFSSTQNINITGAGSIPEVKVFEYTGP